MRAIGELVIIIALHPNKRHHMSNTTERAHPPVYTYTGYGGPKLYRSKAALSGNDVPEVYTLDAEGRWVPRHPVRHRTPSPTTGGRVVTEKTGESQKKQQNINPP